ncbi:hypothetical protein TDB9533_01210 [Thalassocella blandensis]|nr:hypothetical protein TDB9533_01210 [Thalassocella blandensis]
MELYQHKDFLERTLDTIIAKVNQGIADTKNKSNVTQLDLNQVKSAAQVQEQLDKYRAAGEGMDFKALRSEEHNSATLGKHLVERFGFRPNRCHAHAIVAGRHH